MQRDFVLLLETVRETLWHKEVEHGRKVKHLTKANIAIFSSFTVQKDFNKFYCQQQIISLLWATFCAARAYLTPADLGLY